MKVIEVHLSKLQVGLIVLGFSLLLGMGAIAAATNNPDRTLYGDALLKGLNGAPVYQTLVSDDGGVGCNEIAVADGINAMVQCDNIAYVGNSRCVNDAGSQAAPLVKVIADEKYPLGLLKVGVPYVTVETFASPTASCKIFRRQ